MNAPAMIETMSGGLPALVTKAAQALASATTAAEVLEARDAASLAYDAAKRAARLAQAKGAHDTLVAAAHRAQADALLIESQAKRRLADEYDGAQERGEVAKIGDNLPSVQDGNSKPTAADLGFTRRAIMEARQIRDAEVRDPGIVERTVNAALDRGDEPTRAEVKRVINGREDVMERAADEEKAMIDNRDFRALRKLWKASSPGARELFKSWLSAE